MVWFFERCADGYPGDLQRGHQGSEVVISGSEVTQIVSGRTAAALPTEGMVGAPHAFMSEGWRPRWGDPLQTRTWLCPPDAGPGDDDGADR